MEPGPGLVKMAGRTFSTNQGSRGRVNGPNSCCPHQWNVCAWLTVRFPADKRALSALSDKEGCERFHREPITTMCESVCICFGTEHCAVSNQCFTNFAILITEACIMTSHTDTETEETRKREIKKCLYVSV